MKSPTLHLTIWLSVCIVAFVGQGFLYAGIANKSNSVADLQSQINTKNETASRIASARTALAEIAGDEAAVQGYFVSETEIVPFIGNLEEHASAQAATMKVLSVSVSDATEYSTLVLSITVNGTFDAVMRTVGAIEYSPYDLSISKLSLGKDEKNSWHADLELLVGSVPASTETSTKATEQNILSYLSIP